MHFTPGARTAWHTHPLGQTIFVTEGEDPGEQPATNWGKKVTDEEYQALSQTPI